MATYTIRPSTQQDWRDTAMSKAEFNAIANERKANRAGSGFDEFGYSRNDSNYVPVNHGITVRASTPNNLWLGWDANYTSSPSKTGEPILSLNGAVKKLSYTNTTTAMLNQITLPSAPTIYPYGTTLTAEQIASGVITHADASNSGLIVNGKFDTDTSGWSTYNTGTLSIVSNKLRLTNGSSVGTQQSLSGLVIGKKYIVELNFYKGTTTSASDLRVGTSTSNSDVLSYPLPSDGYYTTTFTATATTHYLTVRTQSIVSGEYFDIDNIAVFPADAISRSDLVFLESWHEDVSEKDFVYPLGNTQYLGTTGDCGTPIAGTFAGYGTYSLFGNWQASGALIGKGYVWSTLSDANKKAFVANPENNCYLDGDKVIQVRYRMRVVQGLGDSWGNISAISTTALNSYITTGQGVNSPNYYLSARGKLTTVVDGAATYATPIYRNNELNIGDWCAIYSSTAQGTATQCGYEGKCYALPLVLVHRRNQGAYHPVYNSNGSATWVASEYGGNVKWWDMGGVYNHPITNISLCFGNEGISGSWDNYEKYQGFIGGLSGRPDGLFYDQVHEGDILDLRNSSAKVEDYNRLIGREFNKAVAGTTRGSEGEWNLKQFIVTPSTVSTTSSFGSTGAYLIADTTALYNWLVTNNTPYTEGSTSAWWDTLAYIKGNDNNFYRLGKIDNASYIATSSVGSYNNSAGIGQFTVAQQYEVYVATKSTRTKSNTLTHCDIIGNPANYHTAWKQSGVSGTPLIVAEDGTSMLPTGSLTTFKLSKKANATPLQVLKSTDSGATWTALTVTTHYTFSTTTNAITMVTAPATTDLIMVTYQTHTSMAVPATNGEVLAIGDASALADPTTAFVNIATSLIGKVPTVITNPAVLQGFKVQNYVFVSSKFYGSSLWYPIHSSISLGVPTNCPAVKVFPYLTRSNGKAYLQLVFKEMKYSTVNTDWGDDTKFDIVDNVNTTTDYYGQTVLVGQKKIELPYFIGGGE